MKRLDVILCERGLVSSRERAQALILSGAIWSKERRLEKAGQKVDPLLEIEIRSRHHPFVSRAGVKLQHALDRFEIQVAGKVCLDIGASTGGFTDCLLRNGAAKVFAVDVG